MRLCGRVICTRPVATALIRQPKSAAAAAAAAAAFKTRSTKSGLSTVHRAAGAASTGSSSSSSALRQLRPISDLSRRVFGLIAVTGSAAAAAAAAAAAGSRNFGDMAAAETCPTDAVLQEQSRVLDSVYGPYTGPDWKPAAFERTAPRYLWTDAFGVVNYLTLYTQTQQDRYLQQALGLITSVHNTLGHTRDGSSWLPGASDAHPTAAGLRIGKPHPEGHPDGDGQYFHYLTKWAFALAAAAAVTGDRRYLSWSIEMIQHIHPAFTYQPRVGGPKRMYWKMSTDLSQPAVSSMGNLDPYDGLVTYKVLQQQAQKMGVADADVLSREIADMQAIVDAKYEMYQSDDPLDLGEALWLSHWQRDKEPWARHISDSSVRYLDGLWTDGYFHQPRQWRLAFREFGTSIGLQALKSVRPDMPNRQQWQQRIRDIHNYWSSHLNTRDNDITPVMYATTLNPGLWLKGTWEI